MLGVDCSPEVFYGPFNADIYIYTYTHLCVCVCSPFYFLYQHFLCPFLFVGLVHRCVGLWYHTLLRVVRISTSSCKARRDWGATCPTTSQTVLYYVNPNVGGMKQCSSLHTQLIPKDSSRAKNIIYGLSTKFKNVRTLCLKSKRKFFSFFVVVFSSCYFMWLPQSWGSWVELSSWCSFWGRHMNSYFWIQLHPLLGSILTDL